MDDEAPVVPLCSLSEAFQVFSEYVGSVLVDYAGDSIEVDYGNYTHVLKDDDRLHRTSWIAIAIGEPDQVWLTRGKRKKQWLGVQRQMYLKWLRPGADQPPELFAVGVERPSSGSLRLRTWYTVEQPDEYVRTALRRQGGKMIWPTPS